MRDFKRSIFNETYGLLNVMPERKLLELTEFLKHFKL
jgi:hypothetical protein